MVTVGAIADTLKCLKYQSDFADDVKHDLVSKGRKIIDHILTCHCDSNTGEFWENNTDEDKPFIDDDGVLLCDPGHTVEGCGFYAELLDVSSDFEINEDDFRWKRSDILELLPEIVKFVHVNGYSPKGVMYKSIDVKKRCGVADKIDNGVAYKTAPWWNVRECCAAAAKLYQMTGTRICLDAWKKAFSAAYTYYPNPKIGGLMIQTLDAETLMPLPFNPATGNLDPMHSPRARECEIEALELL